MSRIDHRHGREGSVFLGSPGRRSELHDHEQVRRGLRCESERSSVLVAAQPSGLSVRGGSPCTSGRTGLCSTKAVWVVEASPPSRPRPAATPTLRTSGFFQGRCHKTVSPWHDIAQVRRRYLQLRGVQETSAKMEVATDEASTPIKQDIEGQPEVLPVQHQLELRPVPTDLGGPGPIDKTARSRATTILMTSSRSLTSCRWEALQGQGPWRVRHD